MRAGSLQPAKSLLWIKILRVPNGIPRKLNIRKTAAALPAGAACAGGDIDSAISANIGDASYLYQVDECSEYGTSKHVVFLRLLPEQRQVLNQTAYVWPDLKQKNITWQIRGKAHNTVKFNIQKLDTWTRAPYYSNRHDTVFITKWGCICYYSLYPEIPNRLYFSFKSKFPTLSFKHEKNEAGQTSIGRYHSFLCEIGKCDGTLCILGAVAVQPANSKTSEYGTELRTSKSFLPFSCADSCSPFVFPAAAVWPGCGPHTGIFLLDYTFIRSWLGAEGTVKKKHDVQPWGER